MKQFYFKKTKVLLAVLLSMLWIFSWQHSFAQTISLSTTSINAKVAKCEGTVTKTVTIENSGASDLTYSWVLNFPLKTTDSYSNFESGSLGMVKVGNFYYVVNANKATLSKYDATTLQLVDSYSLPFSQPAGVTYDGQYLWVGANASGKIYNFDLSGNQIGSSITLPFSNYSCLTFDGTYFVVAPLSSSTTPIYKIDHKGVVVESFVSNINKIYQIFWAPNNSVGKLVAIVNGPYLYQIELSGGTAKTVGYNEFDVSTEVYSIEQIGSDYLFGDINGGLYQLAPDPYVSINSNKSGSVKPGSSITIPVVFNAQNLSSGDHTGSITISSNDYKASEKTIDYTFTVEGKPVQSLSANTFNFGNVVTGITSSQTFWIRNNGCETLYIKGINGSKPDFSANLASNTVAPFDSTQATIYFNPTGTGEFKDTLLIDNSDKEAAIYVYGNGIGAPVMSLSTDTVKATISACGEPATGSFTISNSAGLSNLNYTATSIDTLRQTSVKYYSSTGETTSHEFVGLNNLVSNKISLTITLNGDYTSSSSEYVTLIIEGETIGVVNTSNLPDGNNYIRTYTFSGEKVSSWLKDGKLSVELVNSSEVNTGYGLQLNKVELLGYIGDKDLTIDPANGTVASGASSVINLAFNAKARAAGSYLGRIMFSTNDPNSLTDSVVYLLNVKGLPSLNLSTTALDFGNIVAGTSLTQSVWLKNTGCDTLRVSNVTGMTSVFSVNKAIFKISPYDSAKMVVTFSPVAVGDSVATLTIENNDSEAKIQLKGKGVLSPVLSVNTDSIGFSINGCNGGKSTQSFTISNSGSSDLKYVILSDFAEDAESSSNIWSTKLYNSTDDLWHKTTIGAHNSKTSWWCGIDNQANYNTGRRINTALISPSLDLTRTSSSNLSFWEKFDTESGYDYCMVDVSTDGGVTWKQLRGEGLCGSSSGWVHRSYDLSAYCGNMVNIRFYYDTRDGINNGTSGWFIDDIKVSGSIPAWLSISDTLGLVPSGQSKSTDVILNADGLTAGTYSTSLVISSNDIVNQYDTVKIAIVVNGAPAIGVSSKSVNFGDVIENTSLVDTIMVYNTGCDTLKVSNITGTTSVFTVDKSSFKVLPYDTAQVLVSFSPVAIGDSVATLTIKSNDADATISLSGKGVGSPVLSLNSSSLSEVNQCGISVTKTLTISNNGGSNLVFDLSADQNWITLSKTQGVVSVGSSVDITVGFVADSVSAGTHTGNIMISTNQSLNSISSVSCSYTVSGSPVINLSQTSFAFPSVFVNGTGYSSLTITNSGCDTLKITNITSSSSEFYTDVTALKILPYQTGTVLVNFTPTATAAVTGKISIYNNDKDTAIYLSGSGKIPGVISVTSNTFDGFYNSGDVVDLVVSFSNEMDVNTTGGIPMLELNTTPAGYAYYTSGSGTRDLVFQYTVGANDNSSDLDYTSINALTLNSGSILDVDGNTPSFTLPDVGTFAAANSIVIDNVQPSVTITSTAASTTPQKPIKVSFNFNEIVEDFELSGLVLSNGTASNLKSTQNGMVWTADVTAIADGVVTVDLPAYSVADLAGNGNTAAVQYSVTYDSSLPLITLSSANVLTNSNPIAVSVVSSVPVTGMEQSDFVVTNGTVSNFAVVTEGSSWTLNITPAADGEVKIDVPVGAVKNGNDQVNPESSSLSVVYDGTVPTVDITSSTASPTSAAKVVVSIKFSETVTDFDASDVSVVNGVASNFVSNNDGMLWTVDVMPSSNGDVTVSVSAGVAKDLAGNSNTAGSFTFKYDDAVAPSISTLSVANITAISAVASFSCNKAGTVYYVVNASTDAAPSATDVVNASSSVNLTVVNGVNSTSDINGLTPNTGYVVYGVLKDVWGTLSSVSSFAFTTLETGVYTISADINVYPNPVSSVLNIDLKNVVAGTRYGIYSVNGQMLTEGLIVSKTTSVNVENLVQATFILRISNGDNHAEYKVVKK
jgi:hypothetical protein